MRVVASLLLLCTFALAGCLSDASDGGQSDEADRAATRTETARVLLAQPAALDAAPTDQTAGGRASFDMPAGTLSMVGEADWSCVTMCPMVLRLVAPDGTVMAEESGWGLEFEVDAPPSGTWLAEWAPRDGISLGVTGQLDLTFTVVA